MNTLPSTTKAALGLALLSLGAPLLYAQPVQIAPGKIGSIQFMSGGISKSERASIRRAGEDFKLRIEFSEGANNAPVADAALNITDMKGEPVLELAAAGPIVNVNLPNGAYRVDARLHGRTESRLVALRGRDRAKLHVHWLGTGEAS